MPVPVGYPTSQPKYSIGEIVDLATWVDTRYDFKVVDVRVVYHRRCCEYVWGYKLHKDGEQTGFSFTYIPEGYLRKKNGNTKEQFHEETYL